MAFTETFTCNVCEKPKSEEVEDWWLAWEENISPMPGVEQPVLRVTHWNDFLAHSAEVKHLCGIQCAQTLLGRWMQSAGRLSLNKSV